MSRVLTVAAAQPCTRSGDVASNVAAHVELVERARAELWVFPELSLTGYDLRAPTVDCSDPVLHPLREVAARTGSTLMVGAPVAEEGHRHIATLLVTADSASVAYRKTWLGADEALVFERGDGPTLVAIDGWRVALGICKDTGTTEHVDGVAALEPDLYVAGLVHHAAEREEQDRRGRRLVRACGAPVVFASFAGPTAEGYDATAGCSTIWDRSGNVVARAGGAAGEVVTARLDRST